MSVIPASWVRIRATPDGAKQEVRPEEDPGRRVVDFVEPVVARVALGKSFTLFGCQPYTGNSYARRPGLL